MSGELGETTSAPDAARDRRAELLARFAAGLENLADATPGTDAEADPSPVPPEPSVPGYQVHSVLGSGGMGVVYQARHLRLDRLTALKVIRPEKLSPSLHTRLMSEARSVARLNHPHIVQIYEVGEFAGTAGGETVPYLALEFVPGPTLARRLGRATLEAVESARLVRLVARAVAYAHDRGIVHRDLKPDNILLAPPADEAALNCSLGCPKVSDFGLARSDHADADGQGVMGTPAYMSPEQASGQPAGPAADIHALGALLYRLLSGRPPFEGASLTDILHRVRTEEARPPAGPSVPPELAEICRRCLHKDPADRPTAAEMVRDLERFLRPPDRPPLGDGPDARPPKSWPPRRIIGVVGACLAVAALGLVGAWAAGFIGPAKPDDPGRPGPGVAGGPVKGFIDAEALRGATAVPLTLPASRPLRKGDLVRVRVDLSRPAFAYVLWADTAGKVSPVYPWRDGEWAKRPEAETAVSSLRLPDADGEWKWWPMAGGPAGLESLVLLVRDTPLPAGVDLAAAVGTLTPRPTGDDPRAVAWFENGVVVRDEPMRAPDFKRVVAGPTGIESMNSEIQARLGRYFRYTRTVTFGSLGGDDER